MNFYYFFLLTCFLNFLLSFSFSFFFRIVLPIYYFFGFCLVRIFGLLSYSVRRIFAFFFSLQFIYFPIFFFFSFLRVSLFIVSLFYNSLSFIFLFLTSFLMLVLDCAYFFFSSPLKLFLFYVRKLYFKFLSLERFIFIQFFFSFFKHLLILFFFCFILFLIFFYPSAFSSYLIENRSDEFLDMLSHGVVGVWYSSNWWYFRIWLFYAVFYTLFPKSRLSISENIYFIFYFPLVLKIVDTSFDYLSSFESSTATLGGGLAFMQTYFFYELFLPFSSHYGEGLRTNSSSEYSTNGFDGQELGEWYDDWDFGFEEVAANYSFFDPSNPETYFTYGRTTLFNLDLIHHGTVRRNRQANLMRRYLMLPYGMDVGELTFKSNDLADLSSLSEIYYDEAYYLRLLDAEVQSPLVSNLVKHHFSSR